MTERGRPPREPLVRGAQDAASVTRQVSSIALEPRTTRSWFIAFIISMFLVLVLFWSLTELFLTGVGIWGVDIPAAWGTAIVNLVWWMGIAHAGTFISGMLLLLHERWRTSVNRFAETMTLFAVLCGGLFPLIHLGRPSRFHYLIPYPNLTGLWPQFRSPLTWDFLAILAYAVVSLIFWWVGMLPDLALFRDRAKRPLQKKIYGLFALGWLGASRQWRQHERIYILLAGLATPLVTIHSVVAFNFAVTIVPGWHTTLFPPYFLVGGIFSGLAAILTIAIPLRRFFRLEELITIRHIERLAKLLLMSGLALAYVYLNEFFMAWFRGNPAEWDQMVSRVAGPYWPLYWLMIGCNVVVIQLLWSRRIRRSAGALLIISILVNVGMWSERFIIVVPTLHRDFLPSTWGMFYATRWDWATLAGSLGLFAALFYLFLRFLPVLSISELSRIIEKPSEKVET